MFVMMFVVMTVMCVLPSAWAAQSARFVMISPWWLLADATVAAVSGSRAAAIAASACACA
jgi:hypothetical protein